MPVIWLNGTVGAGKSAVGKALAAILPGAAFEDDDDHAGPRTLPSSLRWRRALDALLHRVCRKARARTLVVAYPLDRSGYARLRTACGRGNRALVVINLATPLPMTLRGRPGRDGRRLDPAECARVRAMRSAGYHRRRFAALTLANAHIPVTRVAWRIVRILRSRA